MIISEGVDTIGQYAFCDCPSLSNLIIPSSVRFLNNIVGRQNTIGDDVPMKISCLVEDPRRFGYNENGFFGHFYGYTPTMYIPIGRTDLYPPDSDEEQPSDKDDFEDRQAAFHHCSQDPLTVFSQAAVPVGSVPFR